MSTEIKNFVELTESEKIEILEWRNNPAVREKMFSKHVIELKEHLSFIESLKSSSTSKYWYVPNKGVISLRNIDLHHSNAYLGIYKNPANTEKGIAMELMKYLFQLSFDTLKLHTLKLEVFSDNRKAITFYNKCGFNQEGRLRELYRRPDGIYVDLILMGITEDEYRLNIDSSI